uniref:RRM domain-containing protein n=1 Tax=Parascaris univalens TaxID=6257 RepID=A0A915BZ74_PARUN
VLWRAIIAELIISALKGSLKKIRQQQPTLLVGEIFELLMVVYMFVDCD